MKPPKDCAELARRLEQEAAPLHGRTYHDMIFAAAVLRMFDDQFPANSHYMLGALLAMGRDRFYAVKGEE